MQTSILASSNLMAGQSERGSANALQPKESSGFEQVFTDAGSEGDKSNTDVYSRERINSERSAESREKSDATGELAQTGPVEDRVKPDAARSAVGQENRVEYSTGRTTEIEVDQTDPTSSDASARSASVDEKRPFPGQVVLGSTGSDASALVQKPQPSVSNLAPSTENAVPSSSSLGAVVTEVSSTRLRVTWQVEANSLGSNSAADDSSAIIPPTADKLNGKNGTAVAGDTHASNSSGPTKPTDRTPALESANLWTARDSSRKPTDSLARHLQYSATGDLNTSIENTLQSVVSDHNRRAHDTVGGLGDQIASGKTVAASANSRNWTSVVSGTPISEMTVQKTLGETTQSLPKLMMHQDLQGRPSADGHQPKLTGVGSWVATASPIPIIATSPELPTAGRTVGIKDMAFGGHASKEATLEVPRTESPRASSWVAPASPAPIMAAAPMLPTAGHAKAVQDLAFGSLAGNEAAFDLPHTVLPADFVEQVSWDLRGPMTTSSANAMIAPLRADLPPQVAQQLALALHRAPDRTVELTLNPPELGKVRMVLSASDAGITVTVLTERTETLDLMRRNIDDLGSAFADLGYESIDFAFSQNGAEQEDDQSNHQEGAGAHSLRENAEEDRIAIAIAPLSTSDTGIDVRI